MYKLRRIVFNILLLSFIIRANECYGMEINEKKVEKTVMEKIKALPYSKIFIYGNKFFFSLAHSIINNFYELETLEMNKLYFFKKYLCVGYRLQPTFLAPFIFLDFNVNILGGIIDTAIFLYLCRSSRIKTPSKIFYSLTSFPNINLNIRITKDFYISINIVGLMRAIFYAFFIKNSNNNENDNNSDNNLSDNNNSGDNNENNILKNCKGNYSDQEQDNKGINIQEYNNNPEDNKKNFNQENNNNNPENNNEDKWEKIKKEKGISEEQDRRIQEIYNELDENYGISGFMDEDKVKGKIFDLNLNHNEIVKYIEESFHDN